MKHQKRKHTHLKRVLLLFKTHIYKVVHIQQHLIIMANVIPQQIYIHDNEVLAKFDKDSVKTSAIVHKLLQTVLGSSYERISFRKGLRNVCGQYTTSSGKKVFFMVANLTFMGGKEGQHPKDLKRIQYNIIWREFYEKYSQEGEIFWLGLYSYADTNIWAFFRPETYLQKHSGKSMMSKGGHKAMYSCHIYLTDLKLGFENGEESRFQEKEDKNGNKVGAVKFELLAEFFEGHLVGRNPILSKIEEINKHAIPWKKWIRADYAIPYMKQLRSKTGFNKWKENLWNGWFIEGIYSDFLRESPSPYIHYIGTSQDESIIKEYSPYKLDLGFPCKDFHFIGDLKAISLDDDMDLFYNHGYDTTKAKSISGDSYLNDEKCINLALAKYKRIWFVIYLHDKKKGNTNDYEMVRWRNKYILDLGEWDWKEKPKFNPLSAKNTPHSVSYTEMVVIELNEITKDIYFKLKSQGKNSNGKDRKDKYCISKKFLRGINDDRFVIARYSVKKQDITKT